MTQSLAATTRISCSTTRTVLPDVDQPVELRHQAVHVRGVQAGRRLVEDIERVAAPGALQFGRELDALGLAAGEFGRRLAEPQVAQADFPQDVERAEHLRLVGEESPGRVDRHPQYVGDALAAILDLEGFFAL